MKRALFNDLREAEILTQVKHYLDARQYVFWRTSLGPVLRDGGRRWTKNPMKGFPDVAGVLNHAPGRLWACELKTEKGRLSLEQRAWQARLHNAGVFVSVARSLDEFADWLYSVEKPFKMAENQAINGHEYFDDTAKELQR